MPEENRDEKLAKSAEEAEKARVKARDEQLKEERKAADEVTDQQLERTSQVQPTPTQEENDRARLGQSVEELDDKEDHGAPEEKSTEAGGSAAYNTRAATPKK